MRQKMSYYKTARLIDSPHQAITDAGYNPNQFVFVKFVGKGSFGYNFKISYPGLPTMIASDLNLTSFVL